MARQSLMDDGYDFHPDAALDLEETWECIADHDPVAAGRVITNILDTIERLVPLPQQGHLRPDLTSRPLRFTNTFDYLIAYAPEEKPLWVVAVVHGRRSPRVLAAILSRRQ